MRSEGDSIATDRPVTHQDSITTTGPPAPTANGSVGGAKPLSGKRLDDLGPANDGGFLDSEPPAQSPSDLPEVRPRSRRHPSSSLEPAAALLGWLSLAAIGAAGMGTKIADNSLALASPWAAVFLAGVAVSILLTARRRSARGVRRLLSEVHTALPQISLVDASESSRRADRRLSDLLERTSNFVGGRAAALYVAPASSGRPALRTSVGMDMTSRTVGIAVDVAVSEARPISLVDETDPAWIILSAPLVVGNRVTGAIVVSAPKRWSRTSRMPRLQQIADGGAAVIERSLLGEEEWRNRLGVAHRVDILRSWQTLQ